MGTLAQSTELDATPTGILLIVQSSYPALMIGQLEFGMQEKPKKNLFVSKYRRIHYKIK
jgi:hypothetical protein